MGVVQGQRTGWQQRNYRFFNTYVLGTPTVFPIQNAIDPFIAHTITRTVTKTIILGGSKRHEIKYFRDNRQFSVPGYRWPTTRSHSDLTRQTVNLSLNWITSIRTRLLGRSIHLNKVINYHYSVCDGPGIPHYTKTSLQVPELRDARKSIMAVRVLLS